MIEFLEFLRHFEENAGTGIRVIRNSIDYGTGDNYDPIGVEVKTEVLNAVRFIEPNDSHRSHGNEPIDKWGEQEKDVYKVFLRRNDNAEIDDIVEFNPNLEKHCLPFDSSQKITRLKILKREAGFSDHDLFYAELVV